MVNVHSNGGYAELYEANNDKTDLIPTIEEIESAFADAIEIDGERLVKGELVDLDYSSSHLRWKSTIFRPAPAGVPFVVEPWRDASGGVADLIWCGPEGAWGWSRGVADCLGSEALGGTNTESEPLQIWDTPHDWLDEGRVGFCILRPSARALIPQSAHIRLASWDAIDDWDFVRFPFDDRQMQGPQCADAYAAWVAEKALASAGWRIEPLFYVPRTIDEMPASTKPRTEKPQHWTGPWWPGVLAGREAGK